MAFQSMIDMGMKKKDRRDKGNIDKISAVILLQSYMNYLVRKKIEKMVLPITAYGHPTLRKVATEIDKDYPELEKLIEDMYETMYETSGVGLAAPQVNLPIRFLVLDATPFAEEVPEADGFKRL